MPLKAKQRKILLLNAKPDSAIKFLNNQNCNNLDYWIYLGKNVTFFLEIEKIIGVRIKKIEIGEILQGTASRLRKPYIDFIGHIAQKDNKIAWNLTSISEKNFYSSNLFLLLCYIETLNYAIKKYPGGICIFCEDPSLFRTIRKNLGNNGDLDIQEEIPEIKPTIKKNLQLILVKYRYIQNKVSYVHYFARRIFYARLFQIQKISGQNISKNEPVIGIHSWTDQRSFHIEGSFSEPYYGDLGKLLEENNINNYFYVIDVLGTISYTEALTKLSKIQFQWKLFEDFLNFSDIIRAWYMAQSRKKEETRDIFFLGYEISDLLNEEYARDRYNNRSEVCALYYLAAKKMSRQFSIKTFIYTFENHIWEKMTIEGIRESSPHTKIVGYAHSTVNKMNLVYSLSDNDKNLIPIPDIIVVNGPSAQEILFESGFKDINIQVIGSLRYGNLGIIGKSENPKNKFEILVVLSYDLNKSLELIFKCVEVFSDIMDFSITFKVHPITGLQSLMNSAGNLPEIFSFSSSPLNILFKTANLVIYNDSTASVEAALVGIPLLHIKSDFDIDMNIFEDLKDIPSVSSPSQIQIQSLKILGGEYPSFEKVQTYVRQIFALIDEQKILEIIT